MQKYAINIMKAEEYLRCIRMYMYVYLQYACKHLYFSCNKCVYSGGGRDGQCIREASRAQNSGRSTLCS